MMRKMIWIVLFLLIVSAVVAYELIINIDVSPEAYNDFESKATVEDKTVDEKSSEILSGVMEAGYLDTLDKELYALKKELATQCKAIENSRDATKIQQAIIELDKINPTVKP